MQNVLLFQIILVRSIANNGVDNTIYPRQRSILGGVNIRGIIR
jgi:iron complex outermembrane receptor protein